MKLLNFILFIVILSCATFGQEVDAKKVKAQDILAKAKVSIAKNVKLESIEGLTVSYRTSRNYKENTTVWNLDEMVELGVSDADKIRFDSILDHGDLKTKTNKSLIADGSFFNRKMEVFSKGQKVNANFSFSATKEKEIQRLKNSAWQIIFPITLNDSLYQNLDFTYLGIAESKDGKANAIQTISNGKTYQLFFDIKTNLLLLMTESWTDEENKKPVLTKHFFSDYRDESGLFVAHKIVMQSDSEKIGTGETIIKSVKINPAFKANFFDAK